VNSLNRPQSFPLRLSASTRQQANDLAKREGISLNHFISLAVAEKISRLEHDSFISQQKAQTKPVPINGNLLRLRTNG